MGQLIKLYFNSALLSLAGKADRTLSFEHFTVDRSENIYFSTCLEKEGDKRHTFYSAFFIFNRFAVFRQVEKFLLIEVYRRSRTKYTFPEFIFRNHMSHENEPILRKSISDERKGEILETYLKLGNNIEKKY